MANSVLTQAVEIIFLFPIIALDVVQGVVKIKEVVMSKRGWVAPPTVAGFRGTFSTADVLAWGYPWGYGPYSGSQGYGYMRKFHRCPTTGSGLFEETFEDIMGRIQEPEAD